MTNLPAIIKPANTTIIEDSDWLDQLCEEIQGIIVEAGFTITWTRVKMYWDIGRAIITEHDRQKGLRAQDPTRPRPMPLRQIFQHVGIRLAQYSWLIGDSKTTYYDAVDFAARFPTEESLDDLPDGKATSWSKICRQILHKHAITSESVIASQSKPSLREQLAALIYEQQVDWTHYLLSKCIPNKDGTATIPAWAVVQWTRQIDTPYDQLSEQEKDNIRPQADRVLSTIGKE